MRFIKESGSFFFKDFLSYKLITIHYHVYLINLKEVRFESSSKVTNHHFIYIINLSLKVLF